MSFDAKEEIYRLLIGSVALETVWSCRPGRIGGPIKVLLRTREKVYVRSSNDVSETYSWNDYITFHANYREMGPCEPLKSIRQEFKWRLRDLQCER
jgi:hypothetical protein